MWSSRRVNRVMAIATGMFLSVGMTLGLKSGERRAWPVTYYRDIAPILQRHCIECHRPGDIAPMSLRTYEEAKDYAWSIRQKVVDREMPPWHANPRFGRFANDRSL